MADMGWYQDPSGRHEQRYFDGTRWTEHVADRGVTSVDPVAPAPEVLARADDQSATRHGRKVWPWLVGAAALVLVVIGISVALSGDDEPDEREVVATTVREGDGTRDTTSDVPRTTEAVTTTEPPTTTAAPQLGTRENPAPIGIEQQVGDWQVTVVSFLGDGTAAVMDANSFNESPQNGVYSLVRLRATYTGNETGSPSFAFTVGYLGADARFYEDCSGAVEPDPMYMQPEVAPGGTVEGNFCIDLPQAVLGTGAIYVEEIFSFDDERHWWAGQ